MSSIQLQCPNCDANISPADVNVAIDIAKCTGCNSLFRVSELLDSYPDNKPKPKVTELPKGTQIKVQRGLGNATEIVLPARGLKGVNNHTIFFASFWIIFISIWTIGAAFGNVFFALFSIPFWIVGVMMWVGIIKSISESELIKIDHTSITLIKKSPLSTKRSQFPLGEIDSVGLLSGANVDMKQLFRSKNYMKLEGFNGLQVAEEPAIVIAGKRNYFFAKANLAEKQWVAYFLDTLVNKHK